MPARSKTQSPLPGAGWIVSEMTIYRQQRRASEKKRAEPWGFSSLLRDFTIQGPRRGPKTARFVDFQRKSGFAADWLAGGESFEPSIELFSQISCYFGRCLSTHRDHRLTSVVDYFRVPVTQRRTGLSEMLILGLTSLRPRMKQLQFRKCGIWWRCSRGT